MRALERNKPLPWRWSRFRCKASFAAKEEKHLVWGRDGENNWKSVAACGECRKWYH